MNQVLMVKIGTAEVSVGLFINAHLIASSEDAKIQKDNKTETLENMANSLCIALNVALVEVVFSEKFEYDNWNTIRDILLKRRVMRYKNSH